MNPSNRVPILDVEPKAPADPPSPPCDNRSTGSIAGGTQATLAAPGWSTPPRPGMPVRLRRMYHDRIAGQNWMSCLKHGPIVAVTQERAEHDHAAGVHCPTCCREVADAAGQEIINAAQ